jgi:general secretion pathway protein K
MRRDGERGAALLTVLLLVAVISVLAASGLERIRLSTRLAANAGALEQARGYAYAAETLATTRVTALLGENRERVTLAGGWSGRPFPLPIPRGSALARVSDGGNCFNLNSLVTDTGNGIYAANPGTIAQFARLIRLARAPGAPDAIAAATADWIDSDDAALPGGAEDGAYTGLATGYRTAGTLMADPSELRAVAGVTPALYATLRPWLCTLPTAERAVVNVNTLSPEQAPLVAMLYPDTVSVGSAQAALLKRPLAGFEDTGAFTALLALGGGTDDPGVGAQLGVTSKWFALRIDVVLDGAELQEHALIDARTLPARLVSRQWGEAT